MIFHKRYLLAISCAIASFGIFILALTLNNIDRPDIIKLTNIIISRSDGKTYDLGYKVNERYYPLSNHNSTGYECISDCELDTPKNFTYENDTYEFVSYIFHQESVYGLTNKYFQTISDMITGLYVVSIICFFSSLTIIVYVICIAISDKYKESYDNERPERSIIEHDDSLISSPEYQTRY